MLLLLSLNFVKSWYSLFQQNEFSFPQNMELQNYSLSNLEHILIVSPCPVEFHLPSGSTSDLGHTGSASFFGTLNSPLPFLFPQLALIFRTFCVTWSLRLCLGFNHHCLRQGRLSSYQVSTMVLPSLESALGLRPGITARDFALAPPTIISSLASAVVLSALAIWCVYSVSST